MAVEDSIQKATNYLAEMSSVDKMSQSEALEFYEGVADDVRSAIGGLRYDLGR